MSENPESPAEDRGQAPEGGTAPERPAVAPQGPAHSADASPTEQIHGSGTHAASQGQPATPGYQTQPTQQPAQSQPTQSQPAQSHPAQAQPTQPQPRYGQYAAQPAQPPHPPQYGQQGPSPYGQQGPSQQGPGQHGPSAYGQAPQGYGTQQSHSPYGQPGHGGSSFAPPTSVRRGEPRRWGTGVLIGGMLIAGLIGGGVAAGGYSLLAPRSSSVSQSQNSPVIVNNQDSVNAVTAAAAKASPSVVTIGVTSGNNSGTGSGVVLDNQGHILTNTHVVTLDGAVANPTIQVRTSDGSVYSATVVGTDPLSDLAVVQVKGASLTPITVGDSSKLNVGDNVIAIGAPLGLDSTVTDGIISTLNRTISVASSAAPQGGDQQQGGGSGGFQFAPPNGGQSQRGQTQSTISINVLQTDAAINPGNSGGALVNSKGELVGINVAIASTGSSSSSTSQSGNIGVGFSIPANYAVRIGQELISSGKVQHAQLGVSVQPAAPNGDTNSSFSVGAQIAQVTSGSPADKAGLKAGDVITHFGDFAIGDASELTAAVRQQTPGSTVKVTYTRNGQRASTDVTLGTAS